MPPAMAARFTPGQQAVLGIVADELATRARCDLTIAEIAARAGVSRRLAQGALRLAEGDGLISITMRPRKGQKSLPNLVRVLSRERAAWLAHRQPTGCKPSHPTGTKDSNIEIRGEDKVGFREGNRTLRPVASDRETDACRVSAFGWFSRR